MTNTDPEKVDPALMNRAGRFDRAYEIKLPTEEMRMTVIMKKNIDFLSTEDINHIVQLTDGFSIVQLNELYTMMALEWHYNNDVNYEIIIREMKTGITKQMNQNWIETKSKVGF